MQFAIQQMGYDTDQVDRYIKKLTDEYLNLQRKYAELFGKHDHLVKQSDVSMAAVSKAVVDAEFRAIQIIADANNEAAQIRSGAHVDLAHLRQEKDRVTNEIIDMINVLKGLIPA